MMELVYFVVCFVFGVQMVVLTCWEWIVWARFNVADLQMFEMEISDFRVFVFLKL